MDSMYKSKLTNKILVSTIAIFCTFLWGSAYPAIKMGYTLFNIASTETGAKLTFAGLRFIIAGSFVLIYFFISNKKTNLKSISSNLWVNIVLLGLVQTTIHYFFTYLGISHTSATKTSIINATPVFFSAILSHIFYDNDKLNFRKIVGITIGFIAIIVVNFDKDFKFTSTFKGEGFVIIGAFLTSAGGLYSKIVSERINPVLASGLQLTIGGSILFLLNLSLGGSFPKGNLKAYLLLLYLALLSAVTFSLWTSLLKYNRISMVTIYYFLIPIFGTLLSGLILKEDIFRIQYFLSLPIVTLGIYLVNGQAKTDGL